MKLPRRTALKLLSGTVAAAALPAAAATRTPAASQVRAQADDDVLAIAFDARMRTQVSLQGRPLTGFDSSDALLLENGKALEDFAFLEARIEAVEDARHGPGRRHVVRGRHRDGIEKTVTLTFHPRLPGMAVQRTRYANLGKTTLTLAGWRACAHVVTPAQGGVWTFSGATHEDRRDWVQPVKPGFEQRNTLSMAASDYGGGTPVADVWRRDGGLAVGHVEPRPRLLDLPVAHVAGGGAALGIESTQAQTLAPGQSLETDATFLCVHSGDYYTALVRYRDYMADQDIVAPKVPASAFAPIWCAWGYERHFTTEQVIGTLPKVRELGFEWAVLDDGWQTNEGDWRIDRSKFPRGEADMRAFVQAVKAQGLKPRLWLAPLCADPGSDVLHQHTDMLLLGRDGDVQKVTWWNAFTQCPAYQPTIDYYVALVKTIIGDWGFEGLKLDGQHLNAVAPCYNPAHRHARPEESCEKLGDFWMAIHRAAHEANPEAVVELCPCGTAFAFHNLPATDQYPSSDPLSSWQVRHKGKTAKALMGMRSSYAGDHVELSDGRDDFASSVGIGAVISSKFTWPKDTDKPLDVLPPGGYVLTPQKEAIWRKWVDLYKARMLPQGTYRGELYDIGFDRPEAHAIAKDGAMHYAFYADSFNGAVQLRGLGRGRHRVRDVFNDLDLGLVDARNPALNVRFKRFLLLQATPLGDTA